MIIADKNLNLVNEYTFPDIMAAYLDCRRRKRNKLEPLAFELNHIDYLQKLLEEINSETYEIGPSNVFVVDYPKPREIWAAQFRDRIVHHLIYNSVGRWYENRFIEDTYSCIKGRGTLLAVNRAIKFSRKITENYQKKAFALKLDIANYFVSIDKPILWKIMMRDLGNETLTTRLIYQNIFHNPTKNCIIKTLKTRRGLVPKHKSLWTYENQGLAIGNLTSQSMSNIYLDGLDKYAKHILKIKYYIRYVDDILIMGDDIDQLREWYKKLNKWLVEERNLYFHPDKVKLTTIKDGFTILGRDCYPYYSSIIGRVKNQIYKVRKKLMDNPLELKYYQSFQSYLGLFKHSNGYNLKKEIMDSLVVPGFLDIHGDYEKLSRKF